MEEYPHFYVCGREMKAGCIGKLFKPPMKPADKTKDGFDAALVKNSCPKDLLEAVEGMSKYMSKLEQNDAMYLNFQGSHPDFLTIAF